jgi:hypothetical protein
MKPLLLLPHLFHKVHELPSGLLHCLLRLCHSDLEDDGLRGLLAETHLFLARGLGVDEGSYWLGNATDLLVVFFKVLQRQRSLLLLLWPHHLLVPRLLLRDLKLSFFFVAVAVEADASPEFVAVGFEHNISNLLRLAIIQMQGGAGRSESERVDEERVRYNQLVDSMRE